MKKQYNIAISKENHEKVKLKKINLSVFVDLKLTELFKKDIEEEEIFSKNWTPEEVEYLKQNKNKTNKEIGEYLRRTISAVKTKRSSIGLLKEREEYNLKKGKESHLWKGGKSIKKEYKCNICGKKLFREDWKNERADFFLCSKKCRGKYMSSKKGSKHPMFKGIWKSYDGYNMVYSPNHPKKDADGYVREHRLIVEKKIGRYLENGEVIHHLNSKRNDNRIENLMLFKNNSEHIKFHIKLRQFGITNPIKRQIEKRWEEFLPKKIHENELGCGSHSYL